MVLPPSANSICQLADVGAIVQSLDQSLAFEALERSAEGAILRAPANLAGDVGPGRTAN